MKPILDCHIHMPFEKGGSNSWFPSISTIDEAFAYLDECGVTGGILSSSRCQSAETAEDIEAGNREMVRMVRRYPERYTGGVIVSPNWLGDALREMEFFRKEHGFVWLGELVGSGLNYTYDTPAFDRIIRKAVELDMVLQLHTKSDDMERMAKKHPDATFVMCHFPVNREEIRPRIEMIARNENVYFDISGASYVRMGALELAVREIGTERIMFGSDLCVCCPATVIARVEHAGLSEQDKENIYCNTLDRLLKERGVKLSGAT